MNYSALLVIAREGMSAAILIPLALKNPKINIYYSYFDKTSLKFYKISLVETLDKIF